MTINAKWLFAAVSSVLLTGMPAQAVVYSLDGGTDFNFSADATTRAGVGTAAGTINTTTGNAGFNNFFTKNYALLGALNGGTALTGPNQGSASATSQNTFTLTSADLSNPSSPVGVIFSYAFSGTSGNPGNDYVTVSLFDANTFTSVPAPNIITLMPNGVNNQTLIFDNSQLIAGTPYNVIFQLHENADTFNTAFAFSNVTVANIPFDFEPMLGLFIVGGLWFGGSVINQSKKWLLKK